MADRQGIEIDYCPQCRGVWLDRGELDKIIEKTLASQNATQPTQPMVQFDEYNQNRVGNPPVRNERTMEPDHRFSSQHQFPKKHRKESFFEDLFDF